jgi:hypothetical protein
VNVELGESATPEGVVEVVIRTWSRQLLWFL